MGRRRRKFLSMDEIVERWIRGWLYHYKVKISRAIPPQLPMATEGKEGGD